MCSLAYITTVAYNCSTTDMCKCESWQKDESEASSQIFTSLLPR